jgi:hypothetical protein
MPLLDRLNLIGAIFLSLFVLFLCAPAIAWLEVKLAYRRWRTAHVES